MPADDSYDELAALLALDALPPDEQADAELRAGTFPAEYAEVAAALAKAVQAAPPAQLREQALARALSRRPAGRPGTVPPPVAPAEAYRRTAEDLFGLLRSLDDAEWAVTAHEEHGSVHDLVAHLVGIERFTAAWLDPAAPSPVDPSVPHVESTRALVAELAGRTPDQLARTWHAAARDVLAAAAAGDPARQVRFHDLASTVDGLLVTRTFELWAHAMDIALATGRPMPVLDDARMALLSARLMRALPLALAYRGAAQPDRTARFVLTGPAGGCYDVPLDPRTGAGTADVTIVVDAVDLCRVAARRLPHGEVAATVDGDAELARLVLGNADAFARD
jgi:uncharacterized protein (TIGR03083 family)